MMIASDARPGDLPVERPAGFEVAVDGKTAKTAKTLGIKFPTSILLRADQMIE